LTEFWPIFGKNSTNFVAKPTKVNHGRLTKIIHLLHPQNPLLDNNNMVYCVWQPVAGLA